MSRSKCIVCTGGIGSGKSYVARIFSGLGIPVYIADERAKELYMRDSLLLKELVNLLGNDILEEGRLNKEVMASKIFPNPALLNKVNDIVHPRVLNDFKLWQKKEEERGAGVVVFESAIFIESPVFHHIADKILVVSAPVNERIIRVIKRDKMSEQQVRERIARQLTDEQLFQRADFIIFADGKRAVLPQVLSLLNEV